MKVVSEQKIKSKSGIICAFPEERYGYFAWPSIARMDNGTLIVGASGFRYDHVCPWGKSIITNSADNGLTWSYPKIVNNTPLDDREGSPLSLGGNKLLMSWFTSDIRSSYEWARKAYNLSKEEQARWEAVFSTWTDDVVAKWKGSWIRTSIDGESWSDSIRVPVSAPHGPIRLRNGDLLYLGHEYFMPGRKQMDYIEAIKSVDEGKTWAELGRVPLPSDDDIYEHFCEPHVVELPSGKLIGLIRYENKDHAKYKNFTMFQTESSDGGMTWTSAKYLDVIGSPPHIIRHSSGALVCVYSCRTERPRGHRVMISWDEGRSWESGFILGDNVPPRDHGYPCSVELPDKSILTVAYQRTSDKYKNCGLVWMNWKLPKNKRSTKS